MRLLVFIYIITFPTLSFSQFVVSTNDSNQLLSTRAVDSVLSNSYATENSISNKIVPSFFNLGIVSRFDFVGTHPTGAFYLFSITSLEFYFTVATRLRLVAMVRFSTPILPSESSLTTQYSIYQQRLGWGAGLVAILKDARNDKGVGLISTMNFVVAGDYTFNDYNSQFGSTNPLYKLEIGFRFNRFIAKNFAFVFGLDFGGGVSPTQSRSIVSYAQGFSDYRGSSYQRSTVIVDNDYDNFLFNVGATIGIMF